MNFVYSQFKASPKKLTKIKLHVLKENEAAV